MPLPTSDAFALRIRQSFAATGVDILTSFTEIPSLSPAFDPQWEDHGFIEQAAQLLKGFALERSIPNISAEIQRIAGRSPALVIRIPSNAGSTASVVIYGHLDKQPAPTPWTEPYKPFKATLVGDELYGRGVVDDGYAVVSALLGIEALANEGHSYPQITIVIEASEESGSPDLAAHMDLLANELRDAALMICLDSGGMDFDHLWLTSSLRGNVVITVDVSVLEYGMHSGEVSGVVPSSFRILRLLLDRIEDPSSGDVLVPECYGPIAKERREEAEALAEFLGESLVSHLPLVGELQLMGEGPELVLGQTWKPTVSIIGMEGIPSIAEGGNVLRAHTKVKISLRLPPTVDATLAQAAVIERLREDPPYGATITVEGEEPAQGWNAFEYEPWLTQALKEASEAGFSAPPMWCGEGGSIPFLASLSAKFPSVTIVATGALGPGSNPHGPDERLSISMASSVTIALANLLHSVATHAKS